MLHLNFVSLHMSSAKVEEISREKWIYYEAGRYLVLIHVQIYIIRHVFQRVYFANNFKPKLNMAI